MHRHRAVYSARVEEHKGAAARSRTHTRARARIYDGARLTHDDASAASPARTERRNPVAPEDYIETHPRGLGNASD